MNQEKAFNHGEHGGYSENLEFRAFRRVRRG